MIKRIKQLERRHELIEKGSETLMTICMLSIIILVSGGHTLGIIILSISTIRFLHLKSIK